MSKEPLHFDIVIVGAGVAGSAMAHALATLPRTKPWRIALVERSFAEPDRIVGELLQPGGVEALHKLDMASALDGIDSVNVEGYLLVEGGDMAQIPYPEGKRGRSFHHGRFITGLRRIALQNTNVTAIEATVSDLVESPVASRVIGVRAVPKAGVVPPDPHPVENSRMTVLGDLVIVANGCFSNFRTAIMGGSGCKPVTKSYFVGTVLKDATLPLPKHGTVLLPRGSGPVLLYQISQTDTRILIDIQNPLPVDLKTHIFENIIPQLPISLHDSAQKAFSEGRIRRMPNSFLPSVQQGTALTKHGVILLGDSWNMRHPLTGGGMTVALNDVVYLRRVFESLSSLDDWDDIMPAVRKWHWGRKPFSSTINILSGTLYGMFQRDDDLFYALRKGCFKYFQRGEEYVSEPVSLLSGLNPSPLLLVRQFFLVTSYCIWLLFTQQLITPGRGADLKPAHRLPTLAELPQLIIQAFLMFWSASAIFVPILWSEIRWWAPAE